MKVNPLTQADFYKTGHIFQYPPKTEQVYSNLTARSAFHAPTLPDFENKIVWFGLQAYIRSFLIECWNREFFSRPKEMVVAEYQRRVDNALGKGAVPVDHIAALHDLGYLPIEIKSLPEGSRVNMRVPVMTIKNTRPEFYWLTNYIETVTSNELWKPATVATIAYEYRRLLEGYAKETGAPLAFVDWQGHDFSCRGMSGLHDAQASGAGHLLSFFGTDTIAAIDHLEHYYGADSDRELIGGSVPATEHSVMCMGGKDDEIGTFRRLITEVYPSGIVSIVSDTWDFFKVITEYASALKPEILARQPDPLGNAKVVFRPDSGDPFEILCGADPLVASDVEPGTSIESLAASFAAFLSDNPDNVNPGPEGPTVSGLFKYENVIYRVTARVTASSAGITIGPNGIHPTYEVVEVACAEAVLTPAEKGAVQCLWELFGGTVNEAGYKVLDSHVGLIYGDSITLKLADEILAGLKAKGFASNNVVFGIGSYTYQYLTRDTFGWAVKATAGIVDGEARELFKDPATDNGVKKSAVGYLRVEKEGDGFVLYDHQTPEQEREGELKTVFLDGLLTHETTLAEIRARLRQQ